MMLRLRVALVGCFLGGLFGWFYPLAYGRHELIIRRFFALEYSLAGATLGFALVNYWLFRCHVRAYRERMKNAAKEPRS